MANIEETQQDRARAKRDGIERELKKCPDFQLYLLTKSLKDRMRMERLLDQNPRFRLWRVLAGIDRDKDRANLHEPSAWSQSPVNDGHAPIHHDGP
jgi:hypothetical protein